MDVNDLVELPVRARDLVLRRWRQLLVGIGVVALVNVVLLELFVHGKLGGGLGSAGDAAAKLPSFGAIALTVTIGYLIVVAYVSLPMAFATSALVEGDDETPHGFLLAAIPAAFRQWLRLAVILSPFLLLAIWAVHSIFSAISSLFESAMSGETGTGGEPGMPFAVRVIGALGKHPIDWALVIVLVGAWCMYAAVDALRIQRGVLPGDPRPLIARHPLAVGVLAFVSALVLGPALRHALSGALRGIVPSLDGKSAEASSVVVVALFSIVCAAFISAVAVTWVSLFGGDDLCAATPGDDDGQLPAEPIGVVAGEQAVTQPAPAPASAQAAAQPTVVDLPQIINPGATNGWWVFAPAGATVGIGVWVGTGAAPRVAVADQAGAWSATHVAADGTNVFVSPADAWYYLALASQEAAPQQLHVRLTLPDGVQLQQQQQQHAA